MSCEFLFIYIEWLNSKRQWNTLLFCFATFLSYHLHLHNIQMIRLHFFTGDFLHFSNQLSFVYVRCHWFLSFLILSVLQTENKTRKQEKRNAIFYISYSHWVYAGQCMLLSVVYCSFRFLNQCGFCCAYTRKLRRRKQKHKR